MKCKNQFRKLFYSINYACDRKQFDLKSELTREIIIKTEIQFISNLNSV